MTENHPPQTALAPPAVPHLVDRYRAQHEAWLSQADELARLRDDVRRAAEREALDIVMNARRDVRRILLNARRELVTLRAQVQAAVDASEPSTRVARARELAGGDPESAAPTSGWSDTVHALGAARHDVRGLLEQARTEIIELSTAAVGVRDGSGSDAAPARVPLAGSLPVAADVPLPAQSPLRWKRPAAVLVGGGVVLLAGAIWLMPAGPSSSTSPTSSVTPSVAAKAAPRPLPTVAPARPGGQQPQARESQALVIDARRPVWIRATVDGRVNPGRTLRSGEALRVADARSVLLRVGDAGAVRVSVNGGPPRPFGRDGEVLTRHFMLAPGTTRASAESAARLAPVTAAPQSTQRPSSIATDPAQAPAPTVSSRTAVAEGPAAVTESIPSRPPGATAAPETSRAVPARSADAPEPEQSRSATIPTDPELHIAVVGEQWLGAYHRRDQNAMTALVAGNVAVADERRPDERFPDGLDVRRTLDQVRVELAGTAAMFTAAMTEQASVAGSIEQRVSWVSQTWVLESGKWRLIQVRIVSGARLNRSAR